MGARQADRPSGHDLGQGDLGNGLDNGYHPGNLIYGSRWAPPAGTTGIATLGPPGTSSERAAQYLCEPRERVLLYDSYEAASRAVLAREAARVLIANAYHGISDFYMDTRLTLELAFVFDTPEYGIAARGCDPIPLASRMATHPAPEALIGQLLPSGYRVSTVAYARSTSAAAACVARGEAELALTTEPAAIRHGLRFISATRTIRMLWSVFVRRHTNERSS